MDFNNKKMKTISHSKSAVGGEEKKALYAIINKNFLAEGDCVERFEKEMARYVGCKYALATSTGTLALHLSLLALDIRRGDEVIIPNYVCRSVLNAVQYTGATPVLCDVDKYTFNILAEQIEKKITKKTKAIIIAHMFGCPLALREIKKFGVPIIEDTAQSIGATYRGKKVGSFGEISVFSFEGTKTITTGEGGMVLTNSKKIFRRLLRLKEPYAKDYMPKYTYRMSDLQAAVGRVQLKKLASFIRKRKLIAQKYMSALNLPGVGLPVVPQGAEHTFQRFIISLKQKNIDHVISMCQREGILVKRAIKPYVLSQYLKLPSKLFPHTHYIMRHCLSLPIYPSLNRGSVQRVIKVVRSQLC